MNPLYWQLNKDEVIPEEVKNLWRELLQKGQIFFYPTETIYGIGTAPYREEWIQNIYLAKGRPEDKPLPLIAASLEDAKDAWVEWNHLVEKLALKFWPGPLTIVLKANPKLPEILHAKTGKIGVRVSSHPVARLLAELAGGLIISTSANPSGEMPLRDPSSIPPRLKNFLAVIIDNGVIFGTPSTVVDCSGGEIKILREGAIPYDLLMKVLDGDSKENQ
ncbi:MAG: L-threonylcarbamoyladenylate synthase [Thermodesulforhabdaceae bacterium]